MRKYQRAVEGAMAALFLCFGIAMPAGSIAQVQPLKAPVLNFYVMDTGGKFISGAHVLLRASGAVCETGVNGRCSLPNTLSYGYIDLTASGFDGIENEYAAPDSEGRIVFVLRTNEEARAIAERAMEEDRLKQERSAAEKEREAIAAKAWAERSRELVKELPASAICAAMGSIWRGESRGQLEKLVMGIDAALVTKEAVRRKLSINKNHAVRELLALGMSECTLYASYGLPEDQNSHVGPWGIKIQHIYRALDTHVYTSNGKVTSWQN